METSRKIAVDLIAGKTVRRTKRIPGLVSIGIPIETFIGDDGREYCRVTDRNTAKQVFAGSFDFSKHVTL